MTRYCWTKGVYVESIRKEAVKIRDYIYKHYSLEDIENFDNTTMFAEDVAFEMGHDEWLDDSNHILWDVASDVETKLKIRQD